MSEVAREYYAGMFERAGLEMPRAAFYKGEALANFDGAYRGRQRMPLHEERPGFPKLQQVVSNILLNTRVLVDMASLAGATTELPPQPPPNKKYHPDRQAATAASRITTQLKPSIKGAGSIKNISVTALAPPEVDALQKGLSTRLAEVGSGVERVEGLTTYAVFTGDVINANRVISSLGAVAAFHGVVHEDGEQGWHGVDTTVLRLNSAQSHQRAVNDAIRQNALDIRQWGASHPFRNNFDGSN